MIYLDTETGGVLPQHPTISLAAIAVDDDGNELAHFDQRIQFDPKDCDPEALKVNHYAAEAWKDAMPPAVAVSRFSAWLRPYCTAEKISKAGKPYKVAVAAGYNVVTFDGPRLRTLYGTQFMPIDYHMRDILQRVIFYYDEHPEAPRPSNYKLTTVAASFGFSIEGAHDALADCRLSAAVHRAMKEAW